MERRIIPPSVPGPISPDASSGTRNDGTHHRTDGTRYGSNGGYNRSLAPSKLAALSEILARQEFARRAGLSFNDKRDVYDSLGYQEKLIFRDYWGRYRRGGIAERVIEAYPRATWSNATIIVEDPDPNVTTLFEQAVQDLFKRLDVWPRFQRADILASIGRYSVLLIGADGELDTELPKFSESSPPLYLNAISENQATIDKLVRDISDARFGLPEEYQLNIIKGTTSITGTIQTARKAAHWSRIIHLADGLLIDDIYGKPQLEAVWNYLDDLMKVVGGGSEAFWLRANPGMQLDIDPETEYEPGDEQLLEDEITEFQHGQRRFIRTRGVDLKQLAMSVAGFESNANAILKLISGTTGIPVRILTGSERGELSSSQDRNNWNDRITERRDDFASPLVRQFIDLMVDRGALPSPSEDYTIQWPEIEELDVGEKATVALDMAKANKENSIATGQPVVTADEIRQNVFGLEPLSDVINVNEGDVLDDLDEALAQLRANEDFDLADDAPEDAEWKAVHRAASRHRETIALTFLATWEDGGNELDSEALIAALESQDTALASSIIDSMLEGIDESLSNILPDQLHVSLADGGESSLRSIKARGSFFRDEEPTNLRAAQVTATFNESNPRAIEWAANRSSQLITEISAETRAGLQALIASGLEEGIPPRRLVAQLRNIIGLRSDQARAVVNLATRLSAAKAGSVVRAGSLKIRVPKNLTGAFLRRQQVAYSRKLLADRALLIARTETLFSSNEGLRELWVQAKEDGNLPDDVVREWIVTPDDRLRDDHAAMDGVRVALDEPFDVPDGTSEPGEAPNCRCSQGLARTKDAA